MQLTIKCKTIYEPDFGKKLYISSPLLAQEDIVVGFEVDKLQENAKVYYLEEVPHTTLIETSAPAEASIPFSVIRISPVAKLQEDEFPLWFDKGLFLIDSVL